MPSRGRLTGGRFRLMILFLDFRNDSMSVARITSKDARWVAAPGRTPAGKAVEKAMKAFGMPAKKPTSVAVAVGGEKGVRDVSWSTVRAAIAAANALAFAWRVPIVPVPVRGDESRAATETLVRAASKGAKIGTWASARYSGEPTITKAKPLF